jgi:hypothetical protein
MYLIHTIKKSWDDPFLRMVIFCVLAILVIVAIEHWDLSKYWKGAYIALLSLSIALFSSSVVAYFLESFQFSRFLENRILDIFIRNEFLQKLSNQKLNEIQDTVCQISYDIPDIASENSLYQFVKNNVLVYLDKPFIKDFEATWDITYIGEYFEITHNRKMTVSSLKDEDIEDELEILLAVRRIPGKDLHQHFPFDKWNLRINNEDGEFENIEAHLNEEGSILRFSYPLRYRVPKDSIVSIEYTLVGLEIDEERVAHLIFKKPTQGFKSQITVYDFGVCDFDYKFSGAIPPRDEQINRTDRRFEIDYDKWMLPMNSFTVYFNRKREG